MSLQTRAHYALWQDFAAAGVTDFLAEAPMDWCAPAAATVTPLMPEGVQKPKVSAALPPKAPSGLKKPEKISEASREVVFDPATCVHFSAGTSPVVLVLSVPDTALAWPTTKTPEGVLLERLLQAINVNVRTSSTLLVRETLTDGQAYTPDMLRKMADYVQALLGQSPSRVGLVFGQMGLSALVGEVTSLSDVRGEGRLISKTHFYATYQPHALLEQPTLKAGAWREALRFQQTFSKL